VILLPRVFDSILKLCCILFSLYFISFSLITICTLHIECVACTVNLIIFALSPECKLYLVERVGAARN
jgi:hypothetical protein